MGDDIRPIGAFLRRTAAEGGWRVVIVDGAEYMNRTAANAILKILEEPPERAILILTTAVPGRLLPTIRSRCRVLGLSALDEATMRAVLATMPDTPSVEEIEAIIPLAHGAPGKAMELLGGDGPALSRLVADVMEGTAGEGQAMTLPHRSQNGKMTFASFFDLLCDAISHKARALAASTDRVQNTDLRPACLALLWQDMMRLRAETEQFNLDKQQAVLTALARVSET